MCEVNLNYLPPPLVGLPPPLLLPDEELPDDELPLSPLEPLLLLDGGGELCVGGLLDLVGCESLDLVGLALSLVERVGVLLVVPFVREVLDVPVVPLGLYRSALLDEEEILSVTPLAPP